MATIRINQLPEDNTPNPNDVVPLDNGTTRNTTIQQLVDTGAPVASQGEAEAGANATKRMTPLTTKQAIEHIGAQNFATLAQLEGQVEDYITNTEAARDAAQEARDDAESARDDAQEAEAVATSMAGTATGAASTAQTSAGQAMGFRNEAEGFRDQAEAARDLSQAWATGTEPGGPGTLSAREEADRAEAARDAAIGAVPNVFSPTRAALAALDTAMVTAAYLKEPGREGQFIWRTGNYSTQIAADTAEGIYIKADGVDADAGAWVRSDFLSGQNVNVAWFGPDRTGSVASQAAFSAAAGMAEANLNNLTIYDAMPQANNCAIVVPGGRYLLTDYVDGHGKAIVWLADEAAQFVNDCAKYLGGQLNRPSRINTIEPFGSQDNACGFSVHAGSGWRGLTSNADKAAGVSGWLSPWDAAQTRNVCDLVGLYVAASAIIPVATVEANYTSTTATVSAASVDAGRLKRGMWLLTKHSPTRYTAFLDSWEVVGGSLILNTTGWRELNTPNTGQANSTPADGVDVIINASNSVWGINTNISLDVGDTTEHAVLGEMGIFNSKAASVTYDDRDFYASGFDIANLGSQKATNFFVARGASFTGYLASMNDVGFRADTWGSYGAPVVGFRYKGSGTAYEYYSTDGTQRLKIAGSTIDFGALGVAGSPAFDFHSSANFNDYDVRLLATGGSAGDGNGFLTVNAATVLLPKTVPATDNAVSLGQSANRWTEVFATNGTINTSDPRLKKFRHDSSEMAALKRAVKRIEIKPFQWLDALEVKGEAARIHIGVSAQDVADAFEAEGLDARRYGLFCEDDEVDHVEVVEHVEVPDEETIDELVTSHEMDGDVAVLRQKTVQVRRPKMRTVPLLNEDGTPVMVEKGVVENGEQVFSEDGRPARQLVAATVDVPVMRLQEVRRIESRPTGRKIMSLRYDQLAMLMIAALGGS